MTKQYPTAGCKTNIAAKTLSIYFSFLNPLLFFPLAFFSFLIYFIFSYFSASSLFCFSSFFYVFRFFVLSAFGIGRPDSSQSPTRPQAEL